MWKWSSLMILYFVMGRIWNIISMCHYISVSKGMYVCCMKTEWLTDTDFDSDHLLHVVMHHDNDPITILSVSHQWFHTTWVYLSQNSRTMCSYDYEILHVNMMTRQEQTNIVQYCTLVSLQINCFLHACCIWLARIGWSVTDMVFNGGWAILYTLCWLINSLINSLIKRTR